MDAAHAERSKLIQKQKQQQTDLEKKVKKAKGLLKEAAQQELEELGTKHEAELAEFDKTQGVAGAAAAPAKEAEEAPAASAKKFREKNWEGLSKKELEGEAAERGLGKKGSKEELIVKLTIFHQEIASRAAREPEPVAEEKPAKKSSSSKSSKKAAKEESDDGGDDDAEGDDDSDSDSDEDVDIPEEELEKQHKREKAVQKAFKFILKDKAPEGFPLAELADRLLSINVTGFSPEMCGYKTIEKFLKRQPETVLRYNKRAQFISPGVPRSK